MKTLVLATVSAAALLAAGGAFAQTTPVAPTQPTTGASADASQIDQIGDMNTATVTQSVTSKANGAASVIEQGITNYDLKSYNNTATVTQEDHNNRSLVVQANTASTDFNMDTSAKGNGNNNATVYQHKGSSLSAAFTYQYGGGNTSNIQQYGTGDAFSGDHNDGNLFGVNDRTSEMPAVTAAQNFRVLTVDDARSLASNHFNNVNSKGQYGAAAVVVQDWAQNDYGSVTQHGSNQRGAVVQAFEGGSTGTIDQNGSNNDALISQEEGRDAAANYANISQTAGASGNVAVISQIKASNGYSTITQNGTNGTAYNYQGAANDTSMITQSNVGASATVDQFAANDWSKVIQEGSTAKNTAIVTQSIANVTSNIYQTGDTNMAKVIQQGPAGVFNAPRTTR